MNLRRAKANEVDVLNRLAIESESYWGEDENYMNLFTEKYKLTENMISNDYVYVMVDNKRLIGFFAILINQDIPELELFYVEKSMIGKGYGTLLWTNMISICKEKGIRKIEFVGSNDVLDFYIKRGAKEVEKIESVLKIGRIVSRLEFEIA